MSLSGPWGWGLRAPYFPSGETDPGKGHFRSRDRGGDSFNKGSS